MAVRADQPAKQNGAPRPRTVTAADRRTPEGWRPPKAGGAENSESGPKSKPYAYWTKERETTFGIGRMDVEDLLSLLAELLHAKPAEAGWTWPDPTLMPFSTRHCLLRNRCLSSAATSIRLARR